MSQQTVNLALGKALLPPGDGRPADPDALRHLPLDEQIGKILTVLSQASLSETTRVIYTSDHGDNLGARGDAASGASRQRMKRAPASPC
jgi:hypothetical protein